MTVLPVPVAATTRWRCSSNDSRRRFSVSSTTLLMGLGLQSEFGVGVGQLLVQLIDRPLRRSAEALERHSPWLPAALRPVARGRPVVYRS